jgi:hypothetical protein
MRTVGRQDRSPLDWLRERRDKSGNPMISDEEYAAGVRLRVDFMKAQMQPRVTSSWSGLPDDRRRRAAPGQGMELVEAVADARERVRKAFAAVGLDHANVLLDVCCLEEGLASLERQSGWPQRSGKIILQLALRQLARHYGFLRAEAERDRARPLIRGWGAEGYRGDLGQWHDGDGSGTAGGVA